MVAWSDYLDGMAARVLGQYSRLGALLDPLTDRLLVLSGAIVAWHFELLPRWALAAAGGRARRSCWCSPGSRFRRGLDLEINMLGRWAVWPVMSALALVLVWDTWFTDALLYFGLALTFGATAQYVAAGIRAVREKSPSSSA